MPKPIDTLQDECEHGDRDDHCCLDCGKEMAEDDAAAAEAAYDALMDR